MCGSILTLLTTASPVRLDHTDVQLREDLGQDHQVDSPIESRSTTSSRSTVISPSNGLRVDTVGHDKSSCISRWIEGVPEIDLRLVRRTVTQMKAPRLHAMEPVEQEDTTLVW